MDRTLTLYLHTSRKLYTTKLQAHIGHNSQMHIQFNQSNPRNYWNSCSHQNHKAWLWEGNNWSKYGRIFLNG